MSVCRRAVFRFSFALCFEIQRDRQAVSQVAFMVFGVRDPNSVLL